MYEPKQSDKVSTYIFVYLGMPYARSYIMID